MLTLSLLGDADTASAKAWRITVLFFQAMQNGMMGAAGMHHAGSHLGHQGHLAHHQMEHGLAQPPQPSGGASSHSPASTASTGSSSQATPTSVPPPTSSASACTSSPSSTSAATSGGQKRCGRPGCSNPVQGWTNSEFCSNECVVGQCREVYTHWSTSTSGSTNPHQTQQQYSAANGSASNRTTTPVK